MSMKIRVIAMLLLISLGTEAQEIADGVYWVYFKDKAGHVYLCGYICGDVEPEAVIKGLDGKVPPFMIPPHMIHLDIMPINPSGKIDRKKLPEPKASMEKKQEYVAPETALEQDLCDVWAKVLGQDKTFHKDYLILAHTAWLAGDPNRAAHLAGRSLELQPYYPNAFRFLSMIYDDSDPDLANRYLATYDYILNQATEGFKIEYPPLPE